MSRNRLSILLHAQDRADVGRWKTLNSSWLDPSTDVIVAFGFQQNTVWFEADNGPVRSFPAGRVSNSSLPEVLASFSRCEFLLTKPNWVLYANWRDVIDRAQTLGAVETATGRTLFRKPKQGERLEYRDETPVSLGTHIVDWYFSPLMHGVVCTRLPHELLWMSPEAGERFLLSMRQSDSLASTVDFFYNYKDLTSRSGINVYLPDFSAFNS